jgi:hypothetical protein
MTKEKQFHEGVRQAAGRDVPSEAVKEAVGYFVGLGRTSFEDEGACADLAARIALFPPSAGRKKKAAQTMLTAGILIESDQFIDAMMPIIEAFRKEVFKTAKPPFPMSLEKAAQWIEKEAKRGFGASIRDKKRGGKLVVGIMKDIAICNQLLGAEYQLGRVFRQIHYLKPVQDNGKQIQQVFKVEVKPYSNVGKLESMTRKLGQQTGFTRQALVAFALTGLRPILAPVHVTVHQRYLGSELRRNSVVITVNSRDLTGPQLLDAYRGFREEVNLLNAKPISNRDREFLELMRGFCNEPSVRKVGDESIKAFWKRVQSKWNRQQLDPKQCFKSWIGPYRKYHRLQEKIKRGTAQQTITLPPVNDLEDRFPD